MERHPALRTIPDAETPVQRVLPRGSVALQVVDAEGWSEADVLGRIEEEARRPFALGVEVPARAHLFRRGADHHLLLLSAHHLLLDFRSLEIVFDELLRGCASDGAPALPEPAAGYPRFAGWQAALLAGPEGERLRTGLLARLQGAPAVLSLPTDRPRPPVRGDRGGAYHFALDPALAARAQGLAREEGVSPYVVLLTAFQLLLQRWTGQDDFLVGSPASGRIRRAFDETVGYLVNPVLVRARLGDDPPVRTALSRGRATRC